MLLLGVPEILPASVSQTLWGAYLRQLSRNAFFHVEVLATAYLMPSFL